MEKLRQIPGIEERASKVSGGSALFFNGKEIAHFHHDNEIDIRLTRKIIRQEGLHHPVDSKIHLHRSPSSDWIEVRFRTSDELDEAVRLTRLALKQYG
jgi:hypothetical protein